ncbi:NAD(P)-binding domain-containing protein [Roseobacter sp.]|uniref:NAD(P)-binding domain-containing protein n=1 Tax=Roseobacter sp. TaxID=1907202 RepID=UPI0025F93279|nr:NAD(P)-binding domain-containing protein [Roseobacter sp.]
MSDIGFIGTGHIAAPMVRFLAERGHSVCVSDRNAQTAQELSASHGVAVAAGQQVLDRSDVVFLCLRPGVAPDVLQGLTFRADQQIISVMAGVSLAALAQHCAPATGFTLTIPLGYLEQGGCPLPACPDPALLSRLFAPENPVIGASDEAAFGMHFAICAMVPGILDLMNTGAGWLASQTGARESAVHYTRQLLAGFLSALPPGDEDQLVRERDALATDDTLSLMMTRGLRDGGAHKALENALSAIGQRLESGP